VTQAHDKLIVSQSFNNLEFFHKTPNRQNIYNTAIFELRRCVMCRENTWLGLRDQKTQERGNDVQLEQAKASAAEGCSSVRECLQNLSSAIKRNHKKIANRSQQHNRASICPINKRQHAKSNPQPSAAQVSARTIQHVPERMLPACNAKHDKRTAHRVARVANVANVARVSPGSGREPSERSAAAKLSASTVAITRPRLIRRATTLSRADLGPRQFPIRRRNVSKARRRRPAPYELSRAKLTGWNTIEAWLP
jgi:hypothetical protein